MIFVRHLITYILTIDQIKKRAVSKMTFTCAQSELIPSYIESMNVMNLWMIRLPGCSSDAYNHEVCKDLALPRTIYVVPQKKYTIYTVIAYICIGKVA